MSASNAPGRYQPIAIVGAACRLPGDISDVDGLWQALKEGRDLVGEAPAERFDATRFIDTSMTRTGKSYTAAGGFLSDVASFDAGYFGITPREAAQMDPQHRMLLELAAEALDNAAIAPRALAGSDTAVYVGICDASYGALQLMRPRSVNAYTMAGAASSLAANRLSHYLDLRGPSMAIDTACSSSLVALDRACRTLWDGTSRSTLAAGVNVLLSPYHYVGFSQASMLSKRGRCAAFSAEADGFVRAEGGGLVVLKRLADARADGDRVHGVILASGSNSDGRTAGISLPNPDAQEALLRQVYEQAGVLPDELVYLEAHGTGTVVGDPAECCAIGRALATRRRTGALPIGSVKSNLGHLEPASGIVGLLKALLVLRHGTAPASLHTQPPNPDIDFVDLNLAPVANTLPLPATPRPVVGVNSFGFGGANAHVIVGAAPEGPDAAGAAEQATGAVRPVVVSAHTPQALREAVARMAERLAQAEPDQFYDLAHTATIRRGAHRHRAVVIADGPREAADRLAATFPGEGAEEAHGESGGAVGEATEHGRVAFVFSGNGSQWAGMGAGLVDDDGPFGTALAEVDAALLPHLGWSVAEKLGTVTEAALAATEVAQPLLFAVQVAVTAVLRECGVVPSAVLGHSVGEVAAAHVAGALSLPQAAWVIAERSRAQAATAGCGRMAALAMPQTVAGEVLVHYPELEVAAVNSDRDVTVSGPTTQLLALAADMSARDTVCTVLELDYAFHSAAMDPLHKPLLRALDGLAPSPARVPLYSTVTGRRIDGTELNAVYWWQNVRKPIQFAPAVEAAMERGTGIFLEVGPHPVLRPYLRRATGRTRTGISTVVPTLRRATDCGQALRKAVEATMAAGADIEWTRYFPRPGQVVDLPTYPWQRERHWNGTPHDWVCSSGNGRVEHPLLGERMPGPHPVWHGAVEPALVPWMADHKLAGSVVVPASAYLEMVLAAGERALGTAVSVDRMDISSPLTIPWAEASGVHTQLALNPDDGVVTITSTDEGAGDPRPHVRARVRQRIGSAPGPLDLPGLRARCTRHIAAADQYTALAERGLGYGPSFQVLTELHVGSGEVLASYQQTDPRQQFTADPTLLDGALQAGAPLMEGIAANGDAYLPSAFEAVHVWRAPAAKGLVHVRERSCAPAEVCWDVTVADEDGTVTVELRGCRLRRLASPVHAPVTRHHTVLRAAPQTGTPAAPSPLPASRLIVAACAERIAELRRAWWPLEFAKALEWSQEYVARLIAAAIADLLPDPAKSFTSAELTAAGMLEKHIPLLDLELPVLERYGFVTRTAPGRWALTSAERPSLDALSARLLDFPASFNEAALVVRNGAQIMPLLRGECDPLETLTGEGAGYALELFFDTAPFSRFHNRIAQALAGEMARLWPADRPLRILEVGAGTGGLAGALLPVLPADRTTYLFTDVSGFFLPRAQQRFAQYDFVQYHTFDLDLDPEEQGLAEGGFDLVVAANSLHTCKDLTATLERIVTLLAPGGRLLSMENHNPRALVPWYGAVDGFWNHHTDRELRPRAVLLPREEWPPLLERCGFTDIVQTGDDRASDLASASVTLATAPSGPRTLPPAPPVGPASAAFVIVTEEPAEEPLADSVAELLAAGGRHAVHLVRAHEVRAGEDMRRGRSGIGETAEELHLVLILADSAPSGVGELTERTAQRATLLCDLAQYGEGHLPSGRTSLWLVTRPSGALPAPERAQAPADAAVWGIARTMDNEYPDLAVRRISLDRSGTPAADAHRLTRELLAPSEEDEILLTRGGRFVPREMPLPATPARGADHYALDVHNPGLSYTLDWKATEPREPGIGEVTVAVRAAALNYRDIMSVTGLLPAEASEGTLYTAPGMECAGIVTAVGPGVGTVALGDRVFGLAPTALASHVTTPAQGVQHIPDGMSYEAAATLPVAFCTVHYSLEQLARLQAGETVLIHGGAGGVGLAALQFARMRGAHVIATAGNETKRDLLRFLGAEQVLDSRSLNFAGEVAPLTGGRGVDVVVNSLAGEAIVRSLELLRPGGRFIELGKRDIYENKSLSLTPFRNNLAFFGVDLLSLTHRPDEAFVLIEEVGERVRSGAYRPLPHTVYPAARVREAFELMQHSRHIGKVVVAFDPLDEPVTVAADPARPALDPQGTYLVTGGLSGFGAATAHWLADRGARHLVLVSRRGAEAPEAPSLLDTLTRRGVQVAAHAADCTDMASMGGLLDDIDAGGHPLRGVVHCAMHLDDAPLSELSEERFAAVLAPKAGGALVLDRLTRDRRLDLFLMISSDSAYIGNLHQAAYIAGNLFLEALVRQRRAAGLPAQAIAWGALGETGYVVRNKLTAQLSAVGLEPLGLRDAFAAVDDLLTRDTPVAGVCRYNWGRARGLLPTLRAPRHRLLLPSCSETGGRSREEIFAALAALSPEEARAAVQDAVTQLLARVMQMAPEALDPHRRLDEYGIDSLMATELLVSVRHQFDIDIPPMELLRSGRTIDGLTTLLHLRLGLHNDQSSAAEPPAVAADLPTQRSVTSTPPVPLVPHS
ncbi:type I polyketide synthase [Streptomyces noursei]|uniref:type I polyketide synthase n=1 Tax=Streptomyces noursei TaxID=1971 RepID=UPI001673B08F|nr:type I polyketide synthase [Streptomyces noursei]MCZ1019884.1 type I polyketide synthase [Streptomyces noursei]GGX34058.1 type I polyketide synthase [Streptomyces noursei]